MLVVAGLLALARTDRPWSGRRLARRAPTLPRRFDPQLLAHAHRLPRHRPAIPGYRLAAAHRGKRHAAAAAPHRHLQRTSSAPTGRTNASPTRISTISTPSSSGENPYYLLHNTDQPEKSPASRPALIHPPRRGQRPRARCRCPETPPPCGTSSSTASSGTPSAPSACFQNNPSSMARLLERRHQLRKTRRRLRRPPHAHRRT